MPKFLPSLFLDPSADVPAEDEGPASGGGGGPLFGSDDSAGGPGTPVQAQPQGDSSGGTGGEEETPPPNDPFQVHDAPWAEGFQGEEGGQRDMLGESGDYNDAIDEARRFDFPEGAGPKLGYMGGHFPEPYGGWGMVKDFRNNQKKLEDTTEAEGVIQARHAQEEARIRQDEIVRQQAALNRETQLRAMEHDDAVRRLQALQKQSDEIANTKIDKGNVFASPAGVVGAIAASFMPLFTKDPESGIRVINQAIDRDINVQVMNLQNKRNSLEANRGLYQDYLNMTHDDQIARALTEAKMKDIAAQKVLEVAARYKSPEILAQKQKEAAALRRDGVLVTMDIFAKMWRDPKLADAALRAFWGGTPPGAKPDPRRPFRDTQPGEMYNYTDEAEGEPVKITDAPTRDDRGDTGGSYYQSDVDYIKSGNAKEEAPRTIGTGKAENTFTNPTGEVIEASPTVIGNEPAEPKARQAGGNVMRIGTTTIGPNTPDGDEAVREADKSGASNVIEAADNLVGTKESKAYGAAMKDPRIADEIKRYKYSAIKSYYISEGGKGWGTKNMNPAILRKAYKRWIYTDVKEAEKGVANINHQASAIASVEHQVADMDRYLTKIEANGEAMKHISKINLMNPNWRQQYHQVKLQFGLGDEEDRAVEELYQRWAMLKGPVGKAIYGQMPASEHERLDQWMSDKNTFGQMRDVTKRLSQVTQKEMATAAGQGGNHLAKLFWMAQHRTISGAVPFPGRRPHDRNKSDGGKGIINRDIYARPTVIDKNTPEE